MTGYEADDSHSTEGFRGATINHRCPICKWQIYSLIFQYPVLFDPIRIIFPLSFNSFIILLIFRVLNPKTAPISLYIAIWKPAVTFVTYMVFLQSKGFPPLGAYSRHSAWQIKTHGALAYRHPRLRGYPALPICARIAVLGLLLGSRFLPSCTGSRTATPVPTGQSRRDFDHPCL